MAMTLACNALPLPCRIVEKTGANIVVKALSGRTSAVAKATEALLCFVELEQGDKVMVCRGGAWGQGTQDLGRGLCARYCPSALMLLIMTV